MNYTYMRLELLRTVRNRRVFIISLVFPLALYYFIAGNNKGQKLGDIPFAAYYLAGMASFGMMAAMLSSGARIAGERQVGWNRQLRMTPLPSRSYLATKVLASYLIALVTLGLLLLAGLSLGVHEHALGLLKMLGYVILALIPFAAFGIFIGHKFSVDSIGPMMGGGVALLSIIGGAYGPIGGTSGFMFDLSRATPTYWLVHGGYVLIGGGGWSLRGWVTIAIWIAVTVRLAMRAYQGDTKRQ